MTMTTENNLSREEMTKLLDEGNVGKYTIYDYTVKISEPRAVLIYGKGSNVILVNSNNNLELPVEKALSMLKNKMQ